MNNLIVEASHIHFIIDRPEVEAVDTRRPREFFDRLRVTKDLALEIQGKVEISFYGFENDWRELFESDEMRRYIPALVSALLELFFFVRTQQPTQTLMTFALCQTNVSWVNGRSTRTVTRQLFYDTEQLVGFITHGYIGLNEMID